MAIPGGSVLAMLGGLVDQPMGPAMRMDWRKVHIAFVNHRVVPPGAEKCAYTLAKSSFLDALPTQPHVLTVDGSLSPQEEADRYAAGIQTMMNKAGMGTDPITRLPQFDLVVLGMGKDGHVASLYPGADATEETGQDGAVVAKSVVAQSKADGTGSVTFTPAQLSSAKQVVICLTGQSKADAVAKALEGGVAPKEAPAALVRPRDLGAEVVWLMDAPGASELGVYKGMRALVDR
jgi:6-phosphogluconolactonase